jgi:hypothetical protein
MIKLTDESVIIKYSTLTFSIDNNMAQAQQKKAPIGVKVLTGLAVLTGVLMVMGGVALMALAAEIPLALLPPEQMPLIPALVMGIGATLVAVGGATILLAVGLFKGISLAWRAMTVIAFIGIAVSVVSVVTGEIAQIGSVIINGAILYYLYRPNVKRYFGRAEV